MNAKPRTARRAGRTLSALTLVGAALVTSACANGKEAQTANEKPTLDGTNATAGNMLLRGIVIEKPPAGKKSYSRGDSAALRIVIANKSGVPDTLTDITGPAFAGWASFASADEANAFIAGQQRGAGSSDASGSASATPSSSTPSSGAPSAGTSSSAAPSSSASSSTAPLPLGQKSVPVPAGTSVSFGQAAGPGVLLLQDLKRSSLYPTETVTLKFSFRHAGSVSVVVPVAQLSTPGRASVPPQGGQSTSPAAP